jgi:hypothetical protein
METNRSKEKEFDAVKMMRDIRDKIHSETEGMTFEQLRNYIDLKLANKRRLVGRK